MRIKNFFLLSMLLMTALLFSTAVSAQPASVSRADAGFTVQRLADVTFEDGVDKILFYDDYAYVLTGRTIQMVDISDPEFPITGDSVTGNTGNRFDILRISGDYLYAVDADQTGLFIFSLSNPAAPAQVGFCAVVDQFLISDICVIRDYVYVIKNFGTDISIIDAADPAAPTVVKSLDGYSYLYDIHLFDDTVYYSMTAYSSIGTLDVSDPLNPVSQGSFYYGYRPTAEIFVNGNYLYMGYYYHLAQYTSRWFRVYDLSQWPSPTQLSSIEYPYSEHAFSSLYKAGPYVYAAYGPEGVAVFDVSDPTDASETGTIATGAAAGVVTVYADLIFVGTSTGMEIWNHQELIRHTRPFGYFETPAEGAQVSGGIAVTGWALDDQGIEKIQIFRDPVAGEPSGLVYIGDAVLVKGARPDVEAAYPQCPGNDKAGWGYMLLTNQLPNGNGTFTLHAYAVDVDGHTDSLGSKTITVNNADSVKPFGAIDTPTQGGAASGSSYINFGWALTPLPNTIPTDGSTITVWVDGQPLGHPVYNRYRADIATLFPGYNNTDGAVGYYYLDTTAYANGVHNIAWSVSDDAGNTEGIGSRYFTIRNTETAEDTQDTTGNRAQTMDTPFVQAEQSTAPVTVKKGYALSAPAIRCKPGQDGTVTLDLKEGERVEIHLHELYGNNNIGNYKGFIIKDKQRLPLPIGSSFDHENGIFYWQPGPGFRGTFPLVFYVGTCDKQNQHRTKMVKITCKLQ